MGCLNSIAEKFIGFVSAGWIYLKGDVYTIHAGLWYLITCKNGGECDRTSMTNKSQDNDMLEYQIETTLALIACVMAVGSLIIHIRFNRSNVIIYLMVGMVASILSGVLGLIASGKMGHKYLQQRSEQMSNYGRSVYKAPYSAVLTGVGGLMACLVAIVLVVVTHVFMKKQFSLAENQTLQYITSLDTVTTVAAYPDQHLAAGTSDVVSRRLSGPVPPDGAGSLHCVGQTTGNVGGKDTHSRHAVAASVRAGTVVNVTNHVSPGIRRKKSADENSDLVDYGYAVLRNGQHIYINDIYNL